jgi:hypothetical protein
LIIVFEGVKVEIKSICYYKETVFFGFPAGMAVIVVFFAAACDTNNSYTQPAAALPKKSICHSRRESQNYTAHDFMN